MTRIAYANASPSIHTRNIKWKINLCFMFKKKKLIKKKKSVNLCNWRHQVALYTYFRCIWFEELSEEKIVIKQMKKNMNISPFICCICNWKWNKSIKKHVSPLLKSNDAMAFTRILPKWNWLICILIFNEIHLIALCVPLCACVCTYFSLSS